MVVIFLDLGSHKKERLERMKPDQLARSVLAFVHPMWAKIGHGPYYEVPFEYKCASSFLIWATCCEREGRCRDWCCSQTGPNQARPGGKVYFTH
jgi:hypothetical protein